MSLGAHRDSLRSTLYAGYLEHHSAAEGYVVQVSGGGGVDDFSARPGSSDGSLLQQLVFRCRHHAAAELCQ